MTLTACIIISSRSCMLPGSNQKGKSQATRKSIYPCTFPIGLLQTTEYFFFLNLTELPFINGNKTLVEVTHGFMVGSLQWIYVSFQI